jgi:hypothetical protein
MRPDTLTIPCERCGGAADFATPVSPLGNGPGAFVYLCNACNHVTWIEVRSGSPDASSRGEAVPQMVQQHGQKDE